MVQKTKTSSLSFFQSSRQQTRTETHSGSIGYEYTAFGEPYSANTTASVSQRYTYTGREASSVGAPMYYRYRMYDAAVGRFGGRDPAGYPNNLQGNLYDYVYSGPTAYTDAYGLGWDDYVEDDWSDRTRGEVYGWIEDGIDLGGKELGSAWSDSGYKCNIDPVKDGGKDGKGYYGPYTCPSGAFSWYRVIPNSAMSAVQNELGVNFGKGTYDMDIFIAKQKWKRQVPDASCKSACCRWYYGFEYWITVKSIVPFPAYDDLEGWEKADMGKRAEGNYPRKSSPEPTHKNYQKYWKPKFDKFRDYRRAKYRGENPPAPRMTIKEAEVTMFIQLKRWIKGDCVSGEGGK